MKKTTILFVMIFVSFSLSMLATSGRNVMWWKSETEHFIYLYHTEVASVMTEVMGISEETFEKLSEFFGYEPEEKLIIILRGYEDYSNGFAFSSGKAVIITLGDFYPYRVDGYWFKTVISHELGHVFQLSMVNDFLKAIRPFLSRYLTPNALQPLWMAEGFAQLSSEIMNADSYDYRRLPYLLDGLSNNLLFSDSAIVDGKSPIGYEAVYNFGYAFINFLYESYGHEKLVEFLKFKSGIRGIFGISATFKEIYGKTYEELKSEFFQKMGKKYLKASGDIQEEILEAPKSEEILKLSVDNGRLFYVSLDRSNHLYNFYSEDALLYSSAYPIVDFDVKGSSAALVLLERDNEGLQTRLHVLDISRRRLKRTAYEHILRVQLINETTAVVVENEFSHQRIKLIFIDKKSHEVLLDLPDLFFNISQISLSPGARFLAVRGNYKGEKYLLFYDFLKHSEISYFSTVDFSIGGWENGHLLVASENEMGSQIFSVEPEFGKQLLLAIFPRSVLWPVCNNEKLLVVSQKEGFKIFEVVGEAEGEIVLFQRRTIQVDESEESIKGEIYEPLENLRFETLFPYFLGAGMYFEDYLSTTRLSLAAGYNPLNSSPQVLLALKSQEYFPFDIEFRLSFAGAYPDFHCGFNTPNLLDGPFYLKAGISLSFFPKLFGSQLSFGYIDYAEVIGGKSTFQNFITIKDVQSGINTMELSGSISVNWANESAQLAIGTKARAILFGNPELINFDFGKLSSDEKLALGANLSAEISLGVRNFNLLNLLYFFEQGIGGKFSFLFDGNPFQFSLTLYKFESINLYGSYPLKLCFGFSIENLKLKPYFNISF
ncbi:hypothetical protein AT15_08475 [Kosmotoga arenicorallina S304]|uniref:Peptidase MA-like domain-containing protein n=1 Tax=Kosmotoga arenicorallina S304 TaxID=1453497 RepID=A0A176K1L0_9BACT|nr:hypothetical protein [Kosmotoga arenicorallina]OAA31001.1 hypothetical protein AT15_08475 [Kosmotoga arenicorallina S304]